MVVQARLFHWLARSPTTWSRVSTAAHGYTGLPPAHFYATLGCTANIIHKELSSVRMAGGKQAAAGRLAQRAGPRGRAGPDAAAGRGGALGIFTRACLTWVAILLCMSAHGALRELLLAPLLGQLRAHQLSVATGLAVVYACTVRVRRFLGARTPNQLLLVGATWAVLTVGFEVGVAEALGKPDKWQADFDVSRGGLMAFGVAGMALMPLIVARQAEGRLFGRASSKGKAGKL